MSIFYKIFLLSKLTLVLGEIKQKTIPKTPNRLKLNAKGETIKSTRCIYALFATRREVFLFSEKLDQVFLNDFFETGLKNKCKF